MPSSATGARCSAAGVARATSLGTSFTRLRRGTRCSDHVYVSRIGSCKHSLCCESVCEERSAGNPHAPFCGSRRRVTASGDPVLGSVTALVYPTSRRAPRSRVRDRTIGRVQVLGRRRWRKAAGYHRQARVENAVFRYKSIIGPALRARTAEGRQTEARLACNVLNRMAELGQPASRSIGR